MLAALFAFLLYLAPAEAVVDDSASVAAPEAAWKTFSDGTPVPPRR